MINIESFIYYVMSRKIKLNTDWSSRQDILDWINEMERQVKVIKNYILF